MENSLQETRTRIEKVRESDFTRLKDQTYLDHAGAAQYPSRLLKNYLDDLGNHLYSNPHSGSLSGNHVGDIIANVRYRVLHHFRTLPDEYQVIFTSGCTGALKLLAESFDFQGTCDSSQAQLNRKENAKTNGGFYFLNDNHTSVMGMREIAQQRRATVSCFTEADMTKYLQGNPTNAFLDNALSGSGNQLFGFPAQSNFCGRRYSLGWIQEIQKQSESNHVVLDAAGYVTTSELDLGTYKPDFVCISFYKMFGFPTGLGALLVRNSKAHTLKKTFFGGGTVKVAVPSEMFHVQKDDLAERFEDGTINYLDILALRHAFTTFYDITGGLKNTSCYVHVLSRLLYDYLKSCKHNNSNPVAIIYSDSDFSEPYWQGPIITFNILRANGEHMGFADVSKLAQLYSIHLRTGCFCNLGGCQRHLGMSNEKIKNNFQEGHVCGDDMDLVDGEPTGAIRVSLGYSSTLGDLCDFIKFVEDCLVEGKVSMDSGEIKEYVEKQWKSLCSLPIGDLLDGKPKGIPDAIQYPLPSVPLPSRTQSNLKDKSDPSLLQVPSITNSISDVIISPHVSQIWLYPVKSCAGFRTDSWEIGPRGLLYDREWMIVDSAGVNLTQKRCPRLVYIQPQIDLAEHLLILNYPMLDTISVSLNPISDENEDLASHITCLTPVCRDTVKGHIYSASEVTEWLERALGTPGLRLVHQDTTKVRTSKRKPANQQIQAGGSISLANESQYLLISVESVQAFHESMLEQILINSSDPSTAPAIDNLTARFRANIIVAGDIDPYIEETWESITITHKDSTASNFSVQGRCKRCQVICMDQKTGDKQKEVFRALSAVTKRKVTFGVLLNCIEGQRDEISALTPTMISVGDLLSAESMHTEE